MEKRKFMRTAILFATAVSMGLGVLPAYAQWAESSRASAVADCQPSCERAAAPGVRHLCPRYCECSVREAEARFPDFDALDGATRSGNQEIVAVLRQIGEMCARRVTGQ